MQQSHWYLKLPSPFLMLRGFPKGTKPRAKPKPGHKKHSTSSKQPSVSRKEATKAGSSKAPTDSKTGHLKRKKESSLAMDSNPSQTSAKSASSYFIPQQQGVNEGTKNTSYVHLFAEASRIIKLENLAKLVQNVQPSFKELDSREDDPIIVVDDSDEDEDADKDGLHATLNIETEDASHKLELEKNKVEAEVALLKAQPSFSNMGQLNELLVKSLQTEFLKILSAHNFSSSLITELKDLPSKFNELTEEVKGFKKQVHELEIELPGDLKEIPTKLKDFTKTVTIETIQAKLKTLDALPSLLNKVTNALNQFAQAITSKKIEDASVPLAG
ncbi:hypothetical protein Tco_1193479 [Tanacetum coccineum]